MSKSSEKALVKRFCEKNFTEFLTRVEKMVIVFLSSHDLQFGDKIQFTVGVLRFVDVYSDTGSGSADLIGNDRFVLTF